MGVCKKYRNLEETSPILCVEIHPPPIHNSFPFAQNERQESNLNIWHCVHVQTNRYRQVLPEQWNGILSGLTTLKQTVQCTFYLGDNFRKIV